MSVPTLQPLFVAPADIGAITDIHATPAVAAVPAVVEGAGVAIESNASIIDISSLGGVLSTSANLQSAVPAFADVAATAQSFVDAFNNFQSNAMFSERFPLTTESAFPGTSSPFLAALGLEQQNNTASGNVRFTLNLQSLQSSFQANPAETAALLAQTIQSLGAAATKVAGQNPTAQPSPATGSLANTETTTANADAQLQLQQSLSNLALEQAIAANSPNNAATPATPATPAPAADSAASEIANAPVPQNTPPTPLDNAAELASDPSVAAAVAAYRLGIRTPNRSNNVQTQEDVVTAVAAVPRIEPVALDVHRK